MSPLQVRWFTRAEVGTALDQSAGARSPEARIGNLGVMADSPNLIVPPAYAIAHHLIRDWCNGGAAGHSTPKPQAGAPFKAHAPTS